MHRVGNRVVIHYPYIACILCVTNFGEAHITADIEVNVLPKNQRLIPYIVCDDKISKIQLSPGCNVHISAPFTVGKLNTFKESTLFRELIIS